MFLKHEFSSGPWSSGYDNTLTTINYDETGVGHQFESGRAHLQVKNRTFNATRQ